MAQLYPQPQTLKPLGFGPHYHILPLSKDLVYRTLTSPLILCGLCGKPEAFKPETLNSKSLTLNPKTLKPQNPRTLKVLNPKP